MALTLERKLLRLKRLEAALIRSHLQHPDVLPQADYDLLRYALVLGRLQAFAPGAAGPADAGRTVRAEVKVSEAPVLGMAMPLVEK